MSRKLLFDVIKTDVDFKLFAYIVTTFLRRFTLTRHLPIHSLDGEFTLGSQWQSTTWCWFTIQEDFSCVSQSLFHYGHIGHPSRIHQRHIIEDYRSRWLCYLLRNGWLPSSKFMANAKPGSSVALLIMASVLDVGIAHRIYCKLH